ncbi:LOW QUALITY PROTEIN: putative fasciclin-like arabinogalactan protein 20 [Cucurbita moschata]|uniref:LOW QUALITY PROTEIN: putative fasciclin-like arabinogalactan protein 20 n=1 Tax=Cucurbita moschata TaxID=3662 RepID=A0A6J1G1W2_CUCMO|nr:LOW QUALITY PROTEIN: putative fasciclin-like arabinogalactan protein 20 [Cucurbita moschata]
MASTLFISHPSLTLLSILSDNGFVSMAVMLQLIAQSLLSQSNSITIFSPSDTAFAQSGQPSLSLSFDSISCLSTYLPNASNRSRWGTKISTMLADRSLTVTSSRYFHEISLNRVMISSSPIYDDVRSLFLAPISFLILRFSNGQSTMTVFAPSDDTLAARIDDFTDYPSLYCRILWNDLMDLEKGTKLSTYSKGFAISVAKSNGILMINGVAVIYPNMYVNDWLLVHGLLDVFSMAERLSAKESGSEMRNITHGLALDHW